MKHLTLLAVCWLFFGGVFGQSYSFLSYSTSNGLPQSQVQCISQDSNGYLWVGTLGGLSKFNGKKFINYSVNDGLLNNRITAISMIDGKIWIGHEGGVSTLTNGKARNWKFSEEDKKSNVMDIVSFNGLTVIATNFGVLYTIDEKGRLSRIERDPEAIQYNDLQVIGKRLLLASDNGIYETRDLKRFTYNRTFGNRNITGFALKKNGQLWVSTFEVGLFRSNSTLRYADSVPLNASEYTIKKCQVDSKDRIWLTSRSGIIRIDENGRQLFIDDRNGLPIASVKCIFEDRDGAIWIGTDGKGLLRFTGEQFVHYKESPLFPSELFLSATKRKDGTYFFGSYDKGLFQRKGNGPLTPVGIPGTNVWSLKTGSDGTIWCATDIGISAYRPNGHIENYSLRVPGSRVTTIERINKKLYIGGSTGIGVVENGVYRLLPIGVRDYFETEIGTVRSFVNYKGKILFASDNGIFELRADNRPVPFGNFRKGIVTMAVDNSNHLWIGTESGLYLLREGKFVQHPLAKDPASNTINFLEVIGNRLYIGTNNGLFELNTLRLSVDRHYGVNQGLINLETNVNSSFYDGRYLWFGTAEGLVQFDPSLSSSTEGQLAPVLNIGSILLNYAPFNYSNSRSFRG
jgi:ligand-binding sensor domain-containing protein